jgi:hypothetical protein
MLKNIKKVNKDHKYSTYLFKINNILTQSKFNEWTKYWLYLQTF